jgi:hypothetical protein
MHRRMPPARSAFDPNGFTPIRHCLPAAPSPYGTLKQHPASCFTVFQTSHPSPSAGHPTAG